MRRVVFLVGLFVVLGSGPKAEANKAREAGHALWRQGLSRYNVGDFDEAIMLYKEAYRTYPDADILFNLGQAHRRKKTAKDNEMALFYYRAYVREAPSSTRRRDVEDRMLELDKLIEQEAQNAKKPPTGVAPPPRDQTLFMQPTQSEARPGRWYESPIGWTLTGTGLVLGGVSIVSFVSAGSIDVDGALETEKPELRSAVTFRRTIGVITAVAGTAALVGGIVVFVSRSRERPSQPGASIGLRIGPMSVSLHGRF